MPYFTPPDIDLPAFMDPVLEYIASVLPDPVYAFFISILAHCIALFSGILSLAAALFQTNPLQWDAQTVLPPLISVLAAYLALITMYRTSTWVLRTGFWFIKWGTILAALGAAAGWYMSGGSGNVGNSSVISVLGRFVLDGINSGSRRQTTKPEARSRGRASPRIPKSRRPRVWESFDQHREWQFREDQDNQGQSGDAQRIMGQLADSAARVLKESGWWDTIKSTVENISPGVDDQLAGPARSTKSKKERTGRRAGTRTR